MRNGRQRGMSSETEVFRMPALDGGITVFLSLTLTCICALLGGLFESARLAGCGWYTQMALNSSLDSVMSCYHREAWERYRLFFLEYDTEEKLAEEIEAYLASYREADPFYRLGNPSLTVTVPLRITDGNGVWLEEEILDYMRFGIWEMEQDPEALSGLADSFREAEGFQGITASYQENGRKVLGLEKALDRLGDCLKKQGDYLRDCREALSACSGSGFFRAAKKLEKELERMPSLAASYEEEADRLRAELSNSETAAGQQKEALRAGTWGLAEEIMDPYRAYVEEEGSRRLEVCSAAALAEENLSVLEAAVREAEEVQEYIDAWEEDDSGDSSDGANSGGSDGDDSDDSEEELDEEALWQQVLDVLDGFREDTRFQKSGIQDKKKMNVLESISRLAGTDLLEICVPKGVFISNVRLEMEDLPSADAGINGKTMGVMEESMGITEEIMGITEKTMGTTEEVMGSGTGKGISLEGLLERALLSEYTARYFSSYAGCGGEAEMAADASGGFCYEQEYILNGAVSDRENLKAVVNRLIAVREAVNLLAILSDTGMRGEAERMALAITGAAGLSPLTAVAAFFIMTVWAFAESVEDVRVLLDGGSLPFFKTASQWKVSLTGLAEKGTGVWAAAGAAAENGTSGENGPETEKNGLDYQDWIKLFFLLQDRKTASYRRMDMIQKSLRQKQPDFLMKKCAYRVEAQYAGDGPLVPVRRTSSQEY